MSQRCQSYFIARHGSPDRAFELRDSPLPVPRDGEVLIRSEGFGINFADVMARKGLYQDAPPLPCVVGYEAVGRTLSAFVCDGKEYPEGTRVLAFTRFGAYATHVCARMDAVRPIPEAMPLGEALALAVQYCTAYFAAYECMSLHTGDRVLVQAAAGGVGTALVQLLKLKGCYIYGTAGSEAKLDYLRQQGVDAPINYSTTDFYSRIRSEVGKDGLDAVFDSLGGSHFRKGFRLLGHGGRIVGYGAAEQVGGRVQLLSTLGMAAGFGIFSPIELLIQSKAIIGVNMLRIADAKPQALARCMREVVRMWVEGLIRPVVGAEFPSDKLAEAHAFVESRQSMGKVAVRWQPPSAGGR